MEEHLKQKVNDRREEWEKTVEFEESTVVMKKKRVMGKADYKSYFFIITV